MKNRFIILFLVLSTLVACSSDSMINDGFGETAEKRKAVPIKIKKLDGTYTLGGGVLEPCGPNFLNAIGSGTVSHLGKSMLKEDWCFDQTVPNDKGERFLIITAANGDELWGVEATIIWEPTGLAFTEEWTLEGGTGRFSNAKGTLTEYVEISPPQPQGDGSLTGTFTLIGEGSLTY